MSKALCGWKALLFSALVGLALPEGLAAGNGGSAGNIFAGGNDQGMASPVSGSSTRICYASPRGNDAADGLTIRSAKHDVMSCYDAIPAGSILLLDGGRAVPLRACPQRDPAGCGIWIMGPADPNYAHPPAGWRKEKPISFVGGMSTGGESSPGYQTNIASGGSDSKHPGIWLSSADRITFENISITTCLPAVVGTDSSGNPASGQAQDNVFDNVSFWASTSVGCGPGMLIGSSSSRNFIRHSQLRGSTLEHALAASISRRSNIVTFTAMAILPSSWKTGMVVGVVGAQDPSFDGGDFTITVSGARTFTYTQNGPNATSSGGIAASDGNQAIVVNPQGAKGNSLYADDLSLYDGAIKVYPGTSGTTLDVEKVVQEHGSGPAVWIASCDPSMNVTAWDIRNAEEGASGKIAGVRSDCAKNLQGPANRMLIQKASVEVPATQRGAAGPARTTATPPPTDQQSSLKGRLGGQMTAFAVQVGAFHDPANAEHLKAQIGASYGPVVISRADQSNSSLYRVWVGYEGSESAAHELAERLRSAKLAAQTIIVRVN